MRYVSSAVLPRAVTAKMPFKSLSSNLIAILGPLGEVATPVLSMYISSIKNVASRLDWRMKPVGSIELAMTGSEKVTLSSPALRSSSNALSSGPVTSGSTSSAWIAAGIGMELSRFPAKSGMASWPMARNVFARDVANCVLFFSSLRSLSVSVMATVLPSGDRFTSPPFT